MAKKRKIQDRKYNYPKGFIDKRTGKAKRGFMPPEKGAKVFVKGNFDDIRRGNIPYDSLTSREKSVYRYMVSDRNQNTFNFEGKRYYDPSGLIRQRLNQIPRLKDVNNLTNVLSKKQFENLFNVFASPTKPKENLNTTLFEFTKGEKKGKYRTNTGNLLDIITNLKKLERQGYEINIDNVKGKAGIIQLKDFESFKIEQFLEKAKPGEQVKVELIYKVDINPFTKKVKRNTDETQVFEFYAQNAKRKA